MSGSFEGRKEEVQSYVLDTLKRVGAIKEGHFIGVSGRHLSVYIDKDKLLPHTEDISKICRLFAEKFRNEEIDVVVGPALGGIILSQYTANHLSELKGKEILSVFTEKTQDKRQVLTRGYDKLVRGKKVLLVEDTTTVGSSLKKVILSLKKAGAEIVAIGVMVNCNPEGVSSKTFNIPFHSLAEYPHKSYAEDEVPKWLAEKTINTEVGYGKAYVDKRN